MLLKVLLDETLLVVFVNKGLTVGKDGGHDEDGTQVGVEAEPERSTTADGAIPCRRDERRSGTES